MGQEFSEPVVNNPNLGYVGVALRTPNKLRLIHAPPEVVAMTASVIKEINKASGGDSDDVSVKDKYGVPSYTLDEWCFTMGNGKTAATSGKLFTLRMFEEMYKLGYDQVVSSDLSRAYDQATWFFVKSSCERMGRRVVCLAPGKSDTLVMVRADQRFQDIVRRTVQESWRPGIQEEETIQSCGETVVEMKLCGNPWRDFAGEENILSRQMLIKIFGTLGSHNYRLLAGTNIKGGTDSYFFMHDTSYSTSPADMCMISLNKSDRIRLVNCVDMKGVVRDTISSQYGEIQREEDKYGSWEFKLSGYPWCCSGDPAIKSRQLISRISETMLAHGWALTQAIDISRSLDDKSVLLYTRAQNCTTKFACLALSDVHRLRFLDFYPSDTQELVTVVEREYLPGVTAKFQRDATCYEMDLEGPPWTQNSSFNLHARYNQIPLFSNSRDLLSQGLRCWLC